MEFHEFMETEYGQIEIRIDTNKTNKEGQNDCLLQVF